MKKYELCGEIIKEYNQENPGIIKFNMMEFTYWLARKISKERDLIINKDLGKK